jgi:peptidoglycan/xylan/chitin deacetylase (PgdA/CDA1 family)
MVRRAKIAALVLADSLGLNAIFLRSRWRRERLLILCYHGISLDDEHQWDPSLYMPPALLRARLQELRDRGCTVLPLAEALTRMDQGTLPAAAVAITFDDGDYDFYKAAWPVLREFACPATVYLTTYYSEYNRPVFDPMSSYLLWKGRGQVLELKEASLGPIRLDDQGREQAFRRLLAWAREKQLSAREKDALLARLAAALGVNYAELCRKRLLHIMTPAEAAELAAQGLDLQLHTHRHFISREHARFVQEIDDNRVRLRKTSAVEPRHYCYPMGTFFPEFPGWLRELGIESATTCQPGIVDRHSDRLLLPRLIDTTNLTGYEFRAWLSGLASLLPHRQYMTTE